MFDHARVTLRNFLVLLEINEFLKVPQICVQLSLDLGMCRSKVEFEGIIKLSEREVLVHLVDRLLHKRRALLAHSVKEEELKMSFISVLNRSDKVALDILADSLIIHQVLL